MIGYEFELLVRQGNGPLSKVTFLKFHSKLAERGWKPEYDHGTGGLVGSKKDGFYVTTDDGVCIMEINAPPRDTVRECHEQITKLLFELQSIYTELGCSIIGLSTFPGMFDIENRSCANVCLIDQCCEKSYIKYLNSQRFNKFHHALFIIAANQVWLDVGKQDLMKTWNALNTISGILLALFANGPLLNDAPLDGLEGRDILWRKMLNTSQVQADKELFGMPIKPFASIIEYFNFILDRPFYFGTRDEKGFILKDSTKTYRDFLTLAQSEATWFDGASFTVSPTMDDFLKLHQLTFPHVRIKYTMKKEVSLERVLEALATRKEDMFLGFFDRLFLECRGISAQPQNDLSVAPALLLGLQENIDEVVVLLAEHPYAFWYSLYCAACIGGLETVHGGIPVFALCKRLIDIARRVLQARGHGEEAFLAPLEDRILRKKNPAQDALEIWEKGGLKALYVNRDFRKA